MTEFYYVAVPASRAALVRFIVEENERRYEQYLARKQKRIRREQRSKARKFHAIITP